MSLIVTLFTSYGAVGTIIQVNENQVIQFHPLNKTMVISYASNLDPRTVPEPIIHQLVGDVEIRTANGAIIQEVKLKNLVLPLSESCTESKSSWFELLKERLKEQELQQARSTELVRSPKWDTSIKLALNNNKNVRFHVFKPYLGNEAPILLMSENKVVYAVMHTSGFRLAPATDELALTAIGTAKHTHEVLAPLSGFTYELTKEEVIELLKVSNNVETN